MMRAAEIPPGTIFYHGTKADLKVGDLIRPGFRSNFADGGLKHVYFSALLEPAIWGAELANGNGRARIYTIEPTGPFDDDPNLTDKKFSGNITASYRSLDPLRVTGEVDNWVGHSSECLEEMKRRIGRLREQGDATIIED